MSATATFLPSMLYAQACGSVCEGPFQCHWCSAPCKDTWHHSDPPPAIGQRRGSNHAYRPDSPFVCMGCWSYRRRNLTALFLGGGYKDRQCYLDWSWLTTERDVWAIRIGDPQGWAKDGPALLGFLKSPPSRFILALRIGLNAPAPLLQTCHINACPVPPPLTHEFKFTSNNIEHVYTLHELEECLANAETCAESGARLLADLLRPIPTAADAAFKRMEEEGRRGPEAKAKREMTGRPAGMKNSPDNPADKLAPRSGAVQGRGSLQ